MHPSLADACAKLLYCELKKFWMKTGFPPKQPGAQSKRPLESVCNLVDVVGYCHSLEHASMECCIKLITYQLQSLVYRAYVAPSRVERDFETFYADDIGMGLFARRDIKAGSIFYEICDEGNHFWFTSHVCKCDTEKEIPPGFRRYALEAAGFFLYPVPTHQRPFFSRANHSVTEANLKVTPLALNFEMEDLDLYIIQYKALTDIPAHDEMLYNYYLGRKSSRRKFNERQRKKATVRSDTTTSVHKQVLHKSAARPDTTSSDHNEMIDWRPEVGTYVTVKWDNGDTLRGQARKHLSDGTLLIEFQNLKKKYWKCTEDDFRRRVSLKRRLYAGKSCIPRKRKLQNPSQVSSSKQKVTSSKLKVSSSKSQSKSQVSSSKQQVTSSKQKVTSSKSKVSSSKQKLTSSKPKVSSSKPKVSSSKQKVSSSKSQVSLSEPSSNSQRKSQVSSSKQKVTSSKPKVTSSKVVASWKLQNILVVGLVDHLSGTATTPTQLRDEGRIQYLRTSFNTCYSLAPAGDSKPSSFHLSSHMSARGGQDLADKLIKTGTKLDFICLEYVRMNGVYFAQFIQALCPFLSNLKAKQRLRLGCRIIFVKDTSQERLWNQMISSMRSEFGEPTTIFPCQNPLFQAGETLPTDLSYRHREHLQLRCGGNLSLEVDELECFQQFVYDWRPAVGTKIKIPCPDNSIHFDIGTVLFRADSSVYVLLNVPSPSKGTVVKLYQSDCESTVVACPQQGKPLLQDTRKLRSFLQKNAQHEFASRSRTTHEEYVYMFEQHVRDLLDDLDEFDATPRLPLFAMIRHKWKRAKRAGTSRADYFRSCAADWNNWIKGWRMSAVRTSCTSFTSSVIIHTRHPPRYARHPLHSRHLFATDFTLFPGIFYNH